MRVPEEQVDGRRRVVIESVRPQIDCGRFPIKRVVGETVVVEAIVFADGHDQVACQLLYWRKNEGAAQSSPMVPLGNDRWRGEFPVLSVGRYRIYGRRLDRSFHNMAQRFDKANRRWAGHSSRTADWSPGH